MKEIGDFIHRQQERVCEADVQESQFFNSYIIGVMIAAIEGNSSIEAAKSVIKDEADRICQLKDKQVDIAV